MSISIIQTLHLNKTGKDPIYNGLGFLSPEFNWMSWALSCLQLNVLYGEVSLYTNQSGKEILIDELGLPYKYVHINELDIPSNLWALSKLHTYSLQTKPFLHVDGDAFMWEAIDSDLLREKNLYAQNIESNSSFYKTIIDGIKSKNINLPDAIEEELANQTPIKAYNAGIFGGSDLTFFKEYTDIAFESVEKNLHNLKNSDIKDINMVYEQYLFYCLAKKNNKVVKCYFEEEISDMTYKGIVNFPDVPFETKYIHMLGSYKKSDEACMMLAKRLRQNFPKYYYKIIDQCKNAGIELYLDYYNDKSYPLSNKSNNNFAISNIETTNNINWEIMYEIEKDLQPQIELIFGERNKVFDTIFKVNTLAEKKPFDPKSEGQYYLTPCSYIKSFKETECDELDLVLIGLLQHPIMFKMLYDEIKKMFDEDEVNEDEEALLQLLVLKLKRGCHNNLYCIMP